MPENRPPIRPQRRKSSAASIARLHLSGTRDRPRFLALADRGTPRPVEPPLSKERAIEREREDLEASIKYTKALLGK